MLPWVALTLGAPGCVHVYQPMSGLHRPIVIDPTAPNFADLSLTLTCLPSGGIANRQEARMLCERVKVLFENQGAVVRTVDASTITADLEDDAPDEAPEPKTDLQLVLRPREIHRNNGFISWALCISTFTVLPAVNERTFAQDLTVRDGEGFLLLEDSLKGRTIRRFGAGTWVGNKLMDWIVREPEDRLSGDAAKEDLSRDVYTQLSQSVFNAKMRWEVLQQAQPVDTAGVPR